MYIGVACAHNYAVVAVEQQIAVEAIGPSLHREEKADQRGAMSNHCRRYRSVVNVVFDLAVHPVDRSGEERAQNECEQHPVFDEDIGRQYEEIETDVLVEERVVCTIGDVIEKLQDDAPIADFDHSNQHSEQTCTAHDNPGPWQPIAHDRQEIGRRHIARKIRHEGRDRLRRLPSAKTHREPSVQPKYDGSSRPDRKKDGGFGADRYPKNLQITDRGKPQPVNQEVAHEPEQDQANPNGDGRNDEPDHGTLPWYVPFGSGNPDRHGLIIAEMRDACRLIRGSGLPVKAGDAGARSSVAGTANEHKVANSADAARAINQLSSRVAAPERSHIVQCRRISRIWRSLGESNPCFSLERAAS